MPACSLIRRCLLLLAILALRTAPATAQWRVEAWFGDAWNARAPITFTQDGQPDIKLTPNWSTRP